MQLNTYMNLSESLAKTGKTVKLSPFIRGYKCIFFYFRGSFQNCIYIIILTELLHLGLALHISDIDVAGTVTARVPDLVGQNWTIRLSPEIHKEVIV